MLKKAAISFSLASLIAVAGTATAENFNRDQIRIVGSSTVFPFAATVAEQFGKATSFKTPVVESTGSGGGLKLFCAGIGERHPDIANASRRIKNSEVKRCAGNGITRITEVKVGYDGIVLANARSSTPYQLTLKDVFLALAHDIPTGDGTTAKNTNMTWNDVNPALPAVKIEVFGPPPTSGTRDAFVELAMEGGCKTFKWIKALKKTDKNAYKSLCHTIREDGAFVEAGENDNLIVQKLVANTNALGIFGFSFLDQNADKVQGSIIGGKSPSFENIADGAYPISRALYFYVKQAHIDRTSGIMQYLKEFVSEAAWGPDGYLADKGLIPMSDTERKDVRTGVLSSKNLVM
jgi:phosphate transport system substrate-binding protein